jgi:DNA-binding NtrC family response regulator
MQIHRIITGLEGTVTQPDPHPVTKPAHLLRPCVLIVEDEKRLRELLVDVLPEMGCEPLAARSAEEAIKLIERHPPQIALLDLNLPGMSGLELLENLRRRFPLLQSIIMTGFGDLESARAALRLEAVEFLTKPFHLSDIEQALGKARRRLVTAMQPADRIDIAPEPRTLAQAEREMILQALERHAGNRTAAARELGISRRTMHYKLKEYGAG